MNEERLSDYLDHMLAAANDACGFVEGISREDFLADKRTQQAVVMSLVVIGEAAPGSWINMEISSRLIRPFPGAA